MEKRYNLKSPAVKRLMREAKELCESTEQYYAQPLEDNLFEWHFTVQGPADSDFECGRYHGRITLPPEYPMKPPSIMLLTPNGRFETGRKICLSMSAHHPETWQPSWSIRTVLLAIIGFMPTKGGGAIGALDYTPEERKVLAKKSIQWKCSVCSSSNSNVLKEVEPGSERKPNKELEELASQITFKGENETKTENNTTDGVIVNGSLPTTSNDHPLGNPQGRCNEELVEGTAENESRKVRKRGVKRSTGKGGNGQNAAHTPLVIGSGNLSTLLIIALVTCLFILLMRRIYKDSSEST